MMIKIAKKDSLHLLLRLPCYHTMEIFSIYKTSQYEQTDTDQRVLVTEKEDRGVN